MELYKSIRPATAVIESPLFSADQILSAAFSNRRLFSGAVGSQNVYACYRRVK